MSENERILANVQDRYGAVARSGLTSEQAAVREVAKAFGYSEDELASIPAQANMGLSCGNPVAVASLRAGETVVDLGSGGGLDVFLAARQVGPSGKAIGIDMTPDMIERARAGAIQSGLTNTEFHLAQIDAMPLDSNSVDCIISNCVINLTPDKLKVFREMLRVLKPGGRVAISDIALHKPLPEGVKASVEAYVGCIAGALLISEYQELLREAGFSSVVVTETGADLNAYAQAGADSCCGSMIDVELATIESDPLSVVTCCSPRSDAPQDTSCCAEPPTLHDGIAQVLRSIDVNEYAASVRVHAVKSGS